MNGSIGESSFAGSSEYRVACVELVCRLENRSIRRTVNVGGIFVVEWNESHGEAEQCKKTIAMKTIAAKQITVMHHQVHKVLLSRTKSLACDLHT